MAVVIELASARNLDGHDKDAKKDTSEIGYIVTGTTDEYAAYAAIQAAAPAGAGALVRDTIKLKHLEAEHWEATVSYVTPEKQKKDPDVGEIEWDFDTTGGTQNLTVSLKTEDPPIHDPNWNVMPFQGAIGVSKKKTGWDVKGVDIVVPKLELTATTSFAPGTVTLEWIKALAEMTGKTNEAPWKGFEKGELLFMGARIKAKYREKTTITYTFSASENITADDNITFGGIPGAAGWGPLVKSGHQHSWVYFIQEEDNNQVLMKPKQVNVETIYREADFNELGLGN
jgi:hypothetical protein